MQRASSEISEAVRFSAVVGTAGHIDHGKTSLVLALTGTNADRLPEEKRRGITIDLGFAEFASGETSIGFVDVPGHEKFVRNMLAGAHGIDAVALIIAADEGVMPQTREHFQICRLLGIQHGLIILTKADLVDDELLDLVRAETEELVKGSFLESVPVIPFSAVSGEGTDGVKAELIKLSRLVSRRSSDRVMRLPIDRAFSLHGFGSVVTGTLTAGEIANGSDVEILPDQRRARVRGLQVHNRHVNVARSNQRVAINLGGIELDHLRRGMVLCDPETLRPTQSLDAYIELLPSAPRPLRSRARLHLHLGAAEVPVTIQVLDENGEIPPGGFGFIQLRLQYAVASTVGDRFILRANSPQATLAGGEILNPVPHRHRRRDLKETLRVLSELRQSGPEGQISLFIEMAGAFGLSQADLVARLGLKSESLISYLERIRDKGSVADCDHMYFATSTVERLAGKVIDALKAFHKQEPLAPGMMRETLRETVLAHGARELFKAVMSHLSDSGQVVMDREVALLAEHNTQLSAEETAYLEHVESIFRSSGLEPPALSEVLDNAGRNLLGQRARRIVQMLFDDGRLRKIGNDLVFHRDALDGIVAGVKDFAANRTSDRTIDVAQFKEVAGVSRKFAIPLLEYLDSIRVTRRLGPKRLVI